MGLINGFLIKQLSKSVNSILRFSMAFFKLENLSFESPSIGKTGDLKPIGNLRQKGTPHKNYVTKEILMLENLVVFYKKADGKTKKKILGCIFSEKILHLNNEILYN